MELSALRADTPRIPAEVYADPDARAQTEMITHKPTAFGKALFRHQVEALGLTDPAVLAILQEGRADPDTD